MSDKALARRFRLEGDAFCWCPLRIVGTADRADVRVTMARSVELDRPRDGFLNVNQQPLIELQGQIGALPPANPTMLCNDSKYGQNIRP